MTTKEKLQKTLKANGFEISENAMDELLIFERRDKGKDFDAMLSNSMTLAMLQGKNKIDKFVTMDAELIIGATTKDIGATKKDRKFVKEFMQDFLPKKRFYLVKTLILQELDKNKKDEDYKNNYNYFRKLKYKK